MAKFDFPLEPVLADRVRVERQKEQILSRRRLELSASEAELARLNREFERYATVLREDHGSLSSEDLRRYYAYLEHVEQCMSERHKVIAERRTAVEDARRDLLAAASERKAIEKLKERRLKEYRAAQAAQEENELDDARYASRRNIGADGGTPEEHVF